MMRHYGNFTIDTRCDWVQFWNWRRWNWIDFTLIHASAEWDRRLGRVEAYGALLGFHLRLDYLYDANTPFRAELNAMLDEWEPKP
jgi:hypothetical protein